MNDFRRAGKAPALENRSESAEAAKYSRGDATGWGGRGGWGPVNNHCSTGAPRVTVLSTCLFIFLRHCSQKFKSRKVHGVVELSINHARHQTTLPFLGPLNGQTSLYLVSVYRAFVYEQFFCLRRCNLLQKDILVITNFYGYFGVMLLLSLRGHASGRFHKMMFKKKDTKSQFSTDFGKNRHETLSRRTRKDSNNPDHFNSLDYHTWVWWTNNLIRTVLAALVGILFHLVDRGCSYRLPWRAIVLILPRSPARRCDYRVITESCNLDRGCSSGGRLLSEPVLVLSPPAQ
ncbi:hypothetical protein J6590_041813 [Homalodisca vitripennis]|nr:hypothetical protein J6590_041813 [Homalodisca vitripennis]